MSYSKIEELPENRKFYTLSLSDKTTYRIDGETKARIMKSGSQFVELQTGEVINKSFIISISLDRMKTKDEYRKTLPAGERGFLDESSAYIEKVPDYVFDDSRKVYVQKIIDENST